MSDETCDNHDGAFDAAPKPVTDPIAETIARVRELDQAATKGPWRAGRSDMTSFDGHGAFKNVYSDDERGGVHHVTGSVLPYTVGRGEGEECHENAALIAYYRTAAPALADECERLRERVARLEEALRPFVENAAADPEARALVLAEPGFPVEVSCDSCENMHAPPVCVEAVAEPTRPSLLHGHIPPDLKADAQAARKAGKGQLHDE